MTPDPSAILVDRRGGVLLLQLNRPEKRNPRATPLLLAVAEALRDAADDDAVGAVVMTGGDRIFAAGADIGELEASTSDDPVESPRYLAWQAIRAFPKPLLAAVEGWCLGAGAELMMCCDIVVAAKDARIGQPETNLGIIPGAGGTALLPRLVGPAVAMDMVLTGEPISAQRAYNLGLVARVTEPGSAIAEALELAAKIASRAPKALAQAKASVRAALDTPLSAHIRDERQRFISLLGGDEMREGIAAFRDKRPPLWR
ncbi:MAG: enoyl-CoA hydratase-related protein [Sphingobium sp.]